VTLSGLDTCSVALRPTSQDWTDLVLSKPHRPAAAGGVVFLEPGPGNTKMGAFGRGLLWLEGRSDAIVTGSDQGWDLRPVIDVLDVERIAREAFDELAGEPAEWHELRPPAEVRRFDLAHEFAFDQGADGLAFLRTVAGMCPPRRKLDVWTGQDGQPQTVYVRQAGSGVVTERLYDKGVESGSHPPGERLRYEAQRRPPKSLRMRPDGLASADLSAEFGRSISTYVKGSEDVIAAGPQATVEHLAGQVARGELSIAKAERMIGTVALLREYGRAIYPEVRQQQRRLRGLRDAGVALDTQLPPERVIPVGQLLCEAMESFRA
jgi:hypothetical protein